MNQNHSFKIIWGGQGGLLYIKKKMFCGKICCHSGMLGTSLLILCRVILFSGILIYLPTESHYFRGLRLRAFT